MGRRLLKAAIAIALCCAAGGAAAAPGDPLPAALFAALDGAPKAVLPAILSDADAAHYAAAFAIQEHGDWAAADREIAQIEQPILNGYLYAQRYLAASFHPTVEQLNGWLDRYGDLPVAPEVMALVRPSADRARMRGPLIDSLEPGIAHRDDPLWREFPEEESTRAAHQLSEKFRTRLRADNIAGAVSILENAQAHRLVSNRVIDRMKALLAIACFGDGRDQDARRWAEEAADRSGRQVPEAHWVAGLAVWRSGDHAGSAHHFETAAHLGHGLPWLAAASAYWAARANLVGHHPEVFNRWLRQAAAYPHTFYGLLARRTLGQDVEYSWENRSFGSGDLQIIKVAPAGQRALALLQLEDRGHAEDELRQILSNAGPAMASALLALANETDMPDLAVQVADLIAARGGRLPDSAQYPVPDWRPAEGWVVDRALIFAFARQESFFNPKAKGRGGATGLMQVMPGTARALGAKGPLTDPKINLDVGQRYVRRLLSEDVVKGNLCFLAASYNVGPGMVAHWMQTLPQSDDALMFLESIPFQTTRSFVQRVLTNFWTYRNRFGQASPSLDAIASGRWPMYDASPTALSVARHVED